MTATESRTVNATERKPWTTIQDWVSLVLGAYLAIAAAWMTGTPVGWFVTLGVLVVAAALWALGTASSKAPEWTLVILGVLIFLSPWFAGVASIAAVGWTAWVIGVVVVVLAATMLAQREE